MTITAPKLRCSRQSLRRSQEEIKDAIHAVKKGLPRGGPVRNPDVVVDTVTGEVYPKISGAGLGDSHWEYLRAS